jgi:hypothetical protein
LSKNRHKRNLDRALSYPNIINIPKVIKWLLTFGSIENLIWEYWKRYLI